MAAASLASFLAVLTLLTAQLQAGHDPALGRVAISHAGGKTVVTRSSGGAVVQPGTSHHPITTRASGGGDD